MQYIYLDSKISLNAIITTAIHQKTQSSKTIVHRHNNDVRVICQIVAIK